MKHGALLFITGAALVWLCWPDLPWTLPVVWLGANFIFIGLAHFSVGGRISGKSSNGSIPLWSKFLYWPYNLFLYGTWLLSAKWLSREDPLNQVNGDLIVARRLAASEVPPDVAAYVDLTSEFEDPKLIRTKSNYRCFPILDASVPRIEDLREFIAQLPSGKILVHCAQGHGRTGTFAIALLAARGTIRELDEGLKLLQQSRPGIKLSAVQREFLCKYLTARASNK